MCRLAGFQIPPYSYAAGHKSGESLAVAKDAARHARCGRPRAETKQPNNTAAGTFLERHIAMDDDKLKVDENISRIVRDENGNEVEIKVVYDPHFFDEKPRLDTTERTA